MRADILFSFVFLYSSNCSHFYSGHAQNTTRFTFHFISFAVVFLSLRFISFLFLLLNTPKQFKVLANCLLIQRDTHKIHVVCSRQRYTDEYYTVAAALCV